MRILIAEDDFASRRIMQCILSEYGNCDVAINGVEALELFKLSLDEGKPYDLICLDIMMPEMDGHKALNCIREHEKLMEREGLDSVKVIMTTALGDFSNIKDAFIEQCEAYIVKPVETQKVVDTLKKLELI